MEFTNHAAQAGQIDVPTTILKSFADNIESGLADQQSLIFRIADKLHTIKNLREPEAKSPQDKIPSISDFSQFLEQKLFHLKVNNELLYKIEDHLNRII